jgi:hypothetical protein
MIYSFTTPLGLIITTTFGKIFAIMDKHQFKVKLSKCSFAQQSLHYLDHIISQHDVPTDPAKVAAIQSWPTPRNIKEVCSFLGLAHYYRKFVQHFGIISRPLTSLLKKGITLGGILNKS